MYAINFLMPYFFLILLYSSEVWDAYDRTDAKKWAKKPHSKNLHTTLQTFDWPK